MCESSTLSITITRYNLNSKLKWYIKNLDFFAYYMQFLDEYHITLVIHKHYIICNCLAVYVGHKHFSFKIVHWFVCGRKEGNVLFKDALNTFYLWLYCIRHMLKDHSDSERGNLLLPHGLLFVISCKGSFIYTIFQTGKHIPWPLLH